jgi:hypothetical protein
LTLLPSYQRIVNIAAVGLSTPTCFDDFVEFTFQAQAIKSPLTEEEAESIHTKLEAISKSMDDLLEQVRIKKDPFLDLESKLPIGFVHPRTFVQDWLGHYIKKTETLREALAKIIPVGSFSASVVAIIIDIYFSVSDKGEVTGSSTAN